MFKDVLIPLVAWPDPTTTPAIDEAVGLAAALGGQVTVLTFDLEFYVPSNFLASVLMSMPSLVDGARDRCAHGNTAMIAAAEAAGAARGVAIRHVAAACTVAQMAEHLTAHARLHDIAIVPGGGSEVERERMAEAAIFGSGRPVLLLPHTAPAPAARLDRVGLAWDGSRTAARAMADAMPILTAAKAVHVLTVTGEKDIGGHSAAHLLRHLGCHKVTAIPEDLAADGRPPDAVLTDAARRHGLDLLVMGAFGHNRTREFVLGGVTRRILDDPALPVLMAH